MRILAGLVALVLGCAHVAPVQSVYTTPSGKHLVVMGGADVHNEPRAVPEEVVVQAMRASSMFFDEDIRALAPQIVTALPTLQADQHLAVETSDTQIHIYVASNELQIVSFRDGQEISRHASAIPAPAVETHLTNPNIERVEVAPPPTPPTTTTTTTAAPPPEPPPAPPTPTATSTPPPPAPAPAPPPTPPPPVTTGHKPKHHPAPPADDTKQTGRLTEAQIRDKLAELDRLKAKGLITDGEYQQKKKALLDQL
jgi:hypothetical protein